MNGIYLPAASLYTPTSIREATHDDHCYYLPHYLEATRAKPSWWPESLLTGADYPLYTNLSTAMHGPLLGYVIDGVPYPTEQFAEHGYGGAYTGFCPLGLIPRFALPSGAAI